LCPAHAREAEGAQPSAEAIANCCMPEMAQGHAPLCKNELFCGDWILVSGAAKG